jgi:signal transduction histidine kinase/heme/copper-type cytochrome/quinol oxidase subunit 4
LVMPRYDIYFVLLHMSSLLTLLLFFYILKKRSKSQIHYAFLGNLGFMFIWSFAVLLRQYMHIFHNSDGKALMIVSYIGVCYIPVTLLLTGLIFAHTKIKFSWKYRLLFIPPTVSLFILLTNDLHNLFYLKYSFFDDQIVYGKYFMVHSIYSYVCILIGLYYLVSFSIKNSGFFSKQSILIFCGTMIPLSVNVLVTFKIIYLNAYITPITFSLAVFCYLFAILKYEFLSISPVALQKVVDRISDAFIVINEDLYIVDYNKSFMDTFSRIYRIRRNDNLLNMLNTDSFGDIDKNEILGYLKSVKESKSSVSFEKRIKLGSFDRYFTVEITPISNKDIYIGTIILLRDITQSKKDLETLMERERLASLGQLIGGIAHNLKTPIMSLSGGIEALKDLVKEYEQSIDDPGVNREDHHEIADEMLEWLNKMKPYCSYMSDVISAVKGQAVQMNDSTTSSFTLDELIKRVNILMVQELKRYHCKLNTDFQMDMNLELKGEVNNLVQVFDNIIVNAIEAYEDSYGCIDLKIVKSGSNVEFSFKDYGRGIPEEVKDKLFKEMVTTKGKNGTGLGLYMSYSTIKGKFGGDMWFESEEGKGTTFFISIPYTKDKTYQEVS